MATLFLCLTLQAQEQNRYTLFLRSGAFIPPSDLSSQHLAQFGPSAKRLAGKQSFLIQFRQLPTQETRIRLQRSGIELQDYIPNNAFLATATGTLDSALLQALDVRAVLPLLPQQKIQPELANGFVPPHAIPAVGSVDLWVQLFPSFGYAESVQQLRQLNVQVLHELFRGYDIVAVRLNAARLNELADLPYVQYLQPIPGPDQELNNRSIGLSRANVLRSSLSGQRNLRGSGVVVGVGDNANPMNHVDFTGRLINRSGAASGSHGLHVSGTVLGGGIIDERTEGYAPKATLIKQYFSGILINTPAYIQDYGMVITNNSYGNIVECASFGTYTLYARLLDQQLRQYPHLQHVFAAGNYGTYSCSPFPLGFGTVMGDYQSAKNHITVGATDSAGLLTSFSSKGPVRDGRIKPEITSLGRLVLSSWAVNTISTNNGTSMAAPGVSGGLALLYERYRQLNSGTDPKNMLVKALLCNGATDVGNPGPDYSYGFGNMDLRRSVLMMEAGRYAVNSIATGGSQDLPITVPANTARLKVMLCWNDPEASVLSSQTLVNNLDLEVIDAASQITLPYILDTVKANLSNPASRGVDNINNIEQVVIDLPAAGTYTIRVKGASVPQSSPQEYAVVYDVVPVATAMSFPMGGERFFPGETVRVNWDSEGAPAGTCTLEYSTDGGSNWALVASGIPTAQRSYSWSVPAIPTYQGRLRFTHGPDGQQTVTEPFVVLSNAVVSLDAVQCEGHIAIRWNAVSGATDYQVVRLMNDEMVPVANVTDTFYVFRGLSRDTSYVVGVRPRINGQSGIRLINSTVVRQPSSGTCAGVLSNNDIQLDSLLYPAVSGRVSTSTAFTNAETVRIRIRNLDDAATSGTITARYRINGGAWQSDALSTSIAALGTHDHAFSIPADLSAVGSYAIEVDLAYAPDTVTRNNAFARTVRQLANPAINLSTPFLDDLETAAPFTLYNRQVGFDGADRYDFVASSGFGRVRSYLNYGMAYSGQKALTLDVDRYHAAGTVDSLTATFNLSTYDAALDDIHLDFRFKNHGQGNHGANRVWVRGSDQQSWLPAYDLYANQPLVDGTYTLCDHIEVSDILRAAGQNFSSSFQVRWGQYGQYMAADNIGFNGYTFDDIRLLRAVDDIKMVRVDTPVTSSCALTSTTPVRITLLNTANNAVANVPVSFRVDGNAFIPAEIIPSIPANGQVTYTFTATADLSAAGIHTVSVRVQLPTDNIPENDTLTQTLTNAPLVMVTTATPYLTDFETDEGGWYTGGKNSSWEYGAPLSLKISRAASGSKAWKTHLVGGYHDGEYSYLYSPCFNVSSLLNPVLSFQLALDMEDCGASLCDGAYMEYSLDGLTWSRLGSNGQGTNWYNKSYTGDHLWSQQNYTRWHVATIPLSIIPVPVSQLTQLRFRFVVRADQAVSREGIAIDDVHLYDLVNPIYDGTGSSPVITQTAVSGTSWYSFVDGGSSKLIAAIRPNGQNLGTTDVQSHVFTGSVRVNSNQYYHHRNITIKPTNVSLSDSATVRFYFLDSETEVLIAATGCSTCYKPAQVCELGVTKYSNTDDAIENGTLADNAGGTYQFTPATAVRIVPYDKGYYAEFKVKDFSEFWLNNGGLTGSNPLPLQLRSFTARKVAMDDVELDWLTAAEENVSRFEVELSKGNQEYQQGRFQTIGTVAALGTAGGERGYRFVDREPGKAGIRFYRLRMIDDDGRFTFSPVRPLQFDQVVQPQVFPNPSSGSYALTLQAATGTGLSLRVFDQTGKTVWIRHVSATGFLQKIQLDLKGSGFPSGIYLLEYTDGTKRLTFRLIKL